MPGRDFLLIADAVAPLGEGVSPLGAAGLSRALSAMGHRTTVLTLASAGRRFAASPASRAGCEQ